jgi:tetratricopeptide (TPR) repeat protein
LGTSLGTVEPSFVAGDVALGGGVRVERRAGPCVGGSLYWGCERASGRAVLIKRLSLAVLSAAAVDFVERVALTLREVGSPLVGVGFERGHFLLVSECFEGELLSSRLGRGAMLVEEVLGLGLGLLGLVEWWWSSGALVGSLDPGELRVRGEGRGLEVCAQEVRLRHDPWGSVGEESSGPWRSMWRAPELAIPGASPTVESDLYTVGLLLSEALSGGAEGGSQEAVGAFAPSALLELLGRLTRREPQGRYASAGAAKGDLSLIAQAWERGVRDPALVVGYQEARRNLGEASFVGRSALMEALYLRWEEARRGEAALLVLEGRAGEGKSRVLEELGLQALREDGLVLSGRADPQGQGQSFGLWRDVIEALVQRAAWKPWVQVVLREEGEALSRGFPWLAGSLSVWSGGREASVEHSEARVVRAVCRLLGCLGTEGKPALLLLDDVQWADAQSWKVLEQWRRGWLTVNQRVMVVVSSLFQEEGGYQRALGSLGAHARFLLGVLEREAVEAMVSSMLGRHEPGLRQLIWSLGAGNPLLSEEVVYSLLDLGVIERGEGGWRLRAEGQAAAQSLHQLMARRLEVLPEIVRRLLVAGAVLGLAFEVQAAAHLARLPRRVGARAARDALHRRLLWSLGEEVVTLGHESRRRALLEELSEGERRRLHEEAARWYEQRGDARPLVLAAHFARAGAYEEALPYALEAAREAQARSAQSSAEEGYRIALQGEAHMTARERQEALLGLSGILIQGGALLEAQGLLGRVDAQMGDAREVALIWRLRGKILFRQGEMRAAEEALLRGLRQLGRWVPASALGRRALGFLILSICFLKQIFVWRRVEVEGRSLSAEGAASFGLLRQLARVFFFEHDSGQVLWALVSQYRLARGSAGLEASQVYADGSVLWMGARRVEVAERWARRGVELARACGDLRGEGEALGRLGLVIYGQSRLKEAEARLQDAVALLEQASDLWEVHLARYILGMALLRQGRLLEALEVAVDLWVRGEQGENPLAQVEAVELWSKATGGRISESMTAPLLASSPPSLRLHVVQAEAIRLLASGEPAVAMGLLERELRGRRLSQRESNAQCFAWLATATRLAYEEAPREDRRERARWIKGLRGAVKVALRWSGFWQNVRPHALRELAWLRFLEGQAAGAMEALHESVAVAQAQGQRYERALGLEARAQLGQYAGWERAREDRREARLELEALTIPEEEVPDLMFL